MLGLDRSNSSNGQCHLDLPIDLAIRIIAGVEICAQNFGNFGVNKFKSTMVNRQILIVVATNGRKSTARSIRRILQIFMGRWLFQRD